MHVAPIVLISHASGPGGWTAAAESLARCLAEHPSLSVTVRAPGAALEHLAREETEVWESLPQDRIRWLAGGLSDPILPSLPPEAASLQLELETVAMDKAGITPVGLWAGDSWEPGMVDLVKSYGLSLVLLDASLTHPVPDRPGPVERAGQAVMAVPVLTSLPESWPPDGLVAVRVDAAHLDELVGRHRGRLLTPEAYLATHLPGARLAPAVATPGRSSGRETFYRELLMLTRDQGDRRPGREALLRLQSREYLVDGTGLDVELLEARQALDRVRHRGDSWVDMRDVDWDADGLDEVWIGTHDQTIVVDPASGRLEMWVDRTGEWAITTVHPPLPGLLVRGLTPEGDESPVPPMTVESRMQGKNQASISMTDSNMVRCRTEVTGRTLSIELSLSTEETFRFGPEIPVDLHGARLRADGGEWMDVDRPIAITGHRFRITDEQRTILASSPRPCEMFISPLEGSGILIWPHWMSGKGGSYRVALTPS